jgi:hypothetical protein
MLVTNSIVFFNTAAVVLLTCVMPKKCSVTWPRLFKYHNTIDNCSLTDILRDSSTRIANDESPRSLRIASRVSLTAAFSISF